MSDKSVGAFTDFKNSLKNAKQLSNGDRRFNALIIYNFKRQTLKEALSVIVRLTTIEYGEISIDDGEVLNSDIVHMDFSDVYQEYTYEPESTIIIRGKSNRLGQYEVKIIEL